MGENEIKIKL